MTALNQSDLLTKLEKNFKKCQEGLLQINKRNRSVQFKKIHNKHNFDLSVLMDFNNEICSKISSKAIKTSKIPLNILPNSMIDDEDVDVIRNKLKQLLQNLKQIEDETGQQTGFIGFPFIQGHATPDFFLRGPLILFPISLRHRKEVSGGGWLLNFVDSRPIYNGALLAAIKKKAELNIPENIDETFDDMISDISNYKNSDLTEEFLKRVSDWIKKIIPIDESLNNFEIEKIPDMKKTDIETLDEERLHVLNHMIVGNFPQADNEIYKDYGELLSDVSFDIGPLGDLLDIHDPDDLDDDDDDNLEHEYEEINLDKTPDQKLNLVLDSDSTQDRVILESERSKLVVVRGPPGTGKSQVITNLISNALTNSKKILVVCQKRAALDVVLQRLGTVGLDKFVIMLDKEHQDRKQIYQQLYDILMDPTRHDSRISSDLNDISKKINKSQNYLSEYARILHKSYFGGITIHNLYSVSTSNYHAKLNLSHLDFNIQYNELADYLDRFSTLEKLYKKIELVPHAWSNRTSFSSMGLQEKSIILQTIDSLLQRASTSKIVENPSQQQTLIDSIDTYLNHPGFLKLNQKREAKVIQKILDTSDKITLEYVTNIQSSVQDGISFWKKLYRLALFFTKDHQENIRNLYTTFDEFKIKLESLRDGISKFDDMQQWDMKIKDEPDLKKMILICKEKFPSDSDWTKLFEQEIYLYWIDHIESQNPILRGNPIEEYTKNKQNLERFLEKKQQIVKKHIQTKIASAVNLPNIKRRATSQNEQTWNEFSKELTKKRKVKPIRRLFEMYPDNFLEIAPCWLASPESVSKIFPLQRDLFDLVIVDEASQLAVERALPFLYRAKNVVIAGDEKQLQPFDLFQIRGDDSDEYDDDDDDDTITDEKSLFDLSRANSLTIQLEWHYRSKYQDLINFSNHAFYGGSLQVAPNTYDDPGNPPIKWTNCGGVWQDRKNHVEAGIVLDEIYTIWKKCTSNYPSIGVITFNDEQRDLISEQFDKKREEDHEFDRCYLSAVEGKDIDEQPFFKNIENVQGDERDIIIFSIGYAKDTEGKFVNLFGSLSMAGGENRLNVAITRAKQQMIIVCSIDPSEIKKTSTNPGPFLLRQFLEYSKATSNLDKSGVAEVLAELDKPAVTDNDNNTLEFDSMFEQKVYDRLVKYGYTIHPQVGASGYRIDLAVVHPNNSHRYVLAIECDGATFHSAPSARERDVMRQKFLETRGWKFERIWSRNWWKDPDAEIARIRSRIDKEIQSHQS